RPGKPCRKSGNRHTPQLSLSADLFPCHPERSEGPMYLACSASLGCNASLVPLVIPRSAATRNLHFFKAPCASRTASLPFQNFSADATLSPSETIHAPTTPRYPPGLSSSLARARQRRNSARTLDASGR